MAISAIPIALVITELDVGGAERAFVELATRLDRSRYAAEVYVLGCPPPPERDQMLQKLIAANIHPKFLGGRRGWHLPSVLLKLIFHLRRQRPQILQCFLFHANLVGLIAGKFAGVPHRLTGIRVAEPRQWHLRLLRWLRGWAERHVCVSQAVADLMSQQCQFPRHRITVIPNGVDLERFANAQPAKLDDLGVPSGRKIMTFVGRLDPQKGLGWLLHLASQIFSRFKDYDLLVVGHGPARQMLERMVNELNLSLWVRFAGWREDIPEILAASDILVLPSQWEGMPNVVLEAMAAGKPIVACQAEGVTEILGPLSEAQVVPIGDAAAFVQRLAAIIDDPQLAAHLGGENRQRVAQRFTISQMVSEYDHLYTSLLTGDAAAKRINASS